MTTPTSGLPATFVANYRGSVPVAAGTTVAGQGAGNFPVAWVSPGDGVALQIRRLRILNLTNATREYVARICTTADENTLIATAGASFSGTQLRTLLTAPGGQPRPSALRWGGAAAQLGQLVAQVRSDNLPANNAPDHSVLTLEFCEPGVWLYGVPDAGTGRRSILAIFDTTLNSGMRVDVADAREWPLVSTDTGLQLPSTAPIQITL